MNVNQFFELKDDDKPNSTMFNFIKKMAENNHIIIYPNGEQLDGTRLRTSQYNDEMTF